MKYIKTYENVGDTLWIVIYENFDDGSENFQKLFNDQEGAQNYYIFFANEQKYNDYTEHKGRKFGENDYLLSVNDVNEWLGSEVFGFNIECKSIEVLGRFELSNHMKRLIDTKKYNL